jgi:cation diffusion facilitator CzcD-associated flavoprotein CzcO
VFPTAPQVRDYLASYVDRFALAPMIRCNAEVTQVTPVLDTFRVTVRDSAGSEELSADHVVVCAGTFSRPFVPEIRGSERFSGVVQHSSAALDTMSVAGRRVIVVGAGKSALDCAVWASGEAQSVTLLFRRPHWMAPRFLPGRIPSDQVFLSRLSELFIAYHRLTRVERLMTQAARGVASRTFWALPNWLFPKLLRMPVAMRPATRLPSGFENLGLADEIYRLIGSGAVTTRVGEILEFTGGTEIALADGTTLEADVVIFATGWRQPLDFLDAQLRDQIVIGDHFHLYRHVLPPAQPRIGFVGYTSSVSCQLTAEVSAHWLSDVFLGRLTLPTVPEMDAEIARVRAWLGHALPGRPEGYFIGPFQAHYVDELLNDMNLPTRRVRNVIVEFFGPFAPKRYATLGAERRRLRESGGF